MYKPKCKFTLRKNLKDFSELVLTYGRPSKKCKDFMKNFPKHFDPIFGVAVVKLRFHVAVCGCGCGCGRPDDRKAGYDPIEKKVIQTGPFGCHFDYN